MNLLKNRPEGMHTLSLKRQTTRFKSGCFLLGPYSKSIDTLLEVHYTQTRYGGINMKKILVIEDDQITREGIVAFLTHHQYHVLSAVDGHSARNTFDQHDFDLVILDIMIPHEDGLQLLQYFKNTKDVAVMMVTALGDDKTQTTSYDYLADDYVIKPFSLMILEKKVAAILRRYENRVKNIWNYGQAEVHFDTFTAYYNHEVVDLKVKEIQIIHFFIKNPNQILSREQILNELWVDQYPNDRVIDVYIKNIRKHLQLDCIRTVKGLGYVMVLNHE